MSAPTGGGLPEWLAAVVKPGEVIDHEAVMVAMCDDVTRRVLEALALPPTEVDA
jgi:hypothetical protein